MKFRDDTSAFDGEIIEQLAEKGAVNNQFNAFIMNKLSENGIPTHYVERLSATDVLVKRLDMIPLECVVRNQAAGSIIRRLGVEEGRVFDPPLFELFLKTMLYMILWLQSIMLKRLAGRLVKKCHACTN